MKIEARKIFILFFISVAVYSVIVSFFTATVHIDVDEELYIALARSFHYNGQFEYGNQLLNYNCVLYSMLTSLAYYFYSPTTILFVMRIVGVIAMCSSVFPIYLLAKALLRDNRKAFLLSIFLLIMPYMLDSAYLMQEVLSYPLFMWTIYFLYRFFENGDGKNKVFLLLGSIFSVLCVFTKTYMFFIPIVINICSISDILRRQSKKKNIIYIAIYDVVYLLFFAGLYFMIFAINGFEVGNNHYSSQFLNLFPIDINTCVFGVIDCVIYAALFIVNTGIFPICAILYRWRRERGKSWVVNFLVVAIIFLIVEIIFMVVLTEQGIGTLPYKFLFRYFQIFIPFIFILFVKYKEDISFLNSIEIRVMAVVSLCITLAYFVYMNGQTRQAIIDGHIFLFIENITKYILPHADAIVTVLLMIATIFIFYLCGQKLKNVQLILSIGITGMILFWFIEAIQLPYYNNIVAGGKIIQNDSVKIAGYLNEEDYEYVYYVYENLDEKDSYLRNFYGYIKQPYQIISKEDVNELIDEKKNQRFALLAPKGILDDMQNLNMVELQNEKIDMYIIGG